MLRKAVSSFNALEKIEQLGLLFLVLPMLIVFVFIASYERPTFIVFDVGSMKNGDLEIRIRKQTAYLIVKVASDQQRFTRRLLQTDEAKVSKPKFDENIVRGFRVFSIETQYGLNLLAYDKHRFPYRSCQHLKYIDREIIIEDVLINGGIVCDDPRNQHKREMFVYDLNGRSVNSVVANLFSPVFSVDEGQLKIGI